MRFFFKSDLRSLHLLNATQFLGALNDNIFKLLLVYFLINVKGEDEASSILGIAGMVFVIPFLLFSNAAGVLADRISKRNIIVFTKFAEVLIMSLGFFAFLFKFEFGSYLLLFLMATQSAVFGPSKYGIIPELVEEKKVSKANGLLTSFTFLAIIFGTFLASFVTDVSNKNFLLGSFICILIAILGLITSIGISKTEPKRSQKRINPLFFYEIYQTLKMSSQKRHLFSAILGSAYFLFIGSYVQMNIIPFAIQSLNMTEIGGGYLFLTTSIGIALGSILAGRLSKERVEPGISCISGLAIGFLFIFLSLLNSFITPVVIVLILLGIFGGLMLIPLDSFIQIASPDTKRGQVIAASNFLSFLGVLVAALTLYFFGEKLQISAAKGFAIVGIITFFFMIFITGRLAAFFFPYIGQHILFRFIPCEIQSKIPQHPSIICCSNKNLLDIFLLFPFLDKMKVLIPGKKFSRFPWVNSLFSTFRIINIKEDTEEGLTALMEKSKVFTERGFHICLFLEDTHTKEELKKIYKKTYGMFSSNLYFLSSDKKKSSFLTLLKRYKNKKFIYLKKY